jgi:hypothetical protein
MSRTRDEPLRRIVYPDACDIIVNEIENRLRSHSGRIDADPTRGEFLDQRVVDAEWLFSRTAVVNVEDTVAFRGERDFAVPKRLFLSLDVNYRKQRRVMGKYT